MKCWQVTTDIAAIQNLIQTKPLNNCAVDLYVVLVLPGICSFLEGFYIRR